LKKCIKKIPNFKQLKVLKSREKLSKKYYGKKYYKTGAAFEKSGSESLKWRPKRHCFQIAMNAKKQCIRGSNHTFITQHFCHTF
jgi:hypothetical protein